jgi:hypothetical protein
MDYGKLSWEITADRKLLKEGKESMQVEVMHVYRGDVVDSTRWGIVDKDAEAIPVGVQVRRCPRTSFDGQGVCIL